MPNKADKADLSGLSTGKYIFEVIILMFVCT